MDLSRLTRSEQDRFAALLKWRHVGESFLQFLQRTRPAQCSPVPRHLLPLVAAFERCRQFGGQRICLSMPPRAAKSTTVRSGISWWLSHSPADRNIYVSYNADLAAREHGFKTRLESMAAGVVLGEKTANDDWNTIAGGGMRSCGINAGIVGRGADGLVIVDDPFSGFEEGESPVIRDKVASVFWTDVMSRIEGWASVIVVHTRYNEDDLIGRLEPLGNWDVIRIPAIAEDENDILGRKPGESFWPERNQFTLESLKEKQQDPYSFAALYQQKPQGRGQKLFGPHVCFDPLTTNLNGCTPIIGVDPAASEKTAADWSVAVLMAIRNPRNVMTAQGYILDVLRRQVTIPQFARELLAFQRAHWNAPVVIETVGAFKAVAQTLRENAPNLIIAELTTPQELHGDKFLRSQGLAGAWNAARVLVPNNAPPWLEPYLKIMRSFTGVKDANDDDVDATAHAWNFVNGGPRAIRREAKADPGAYGASAA